MKYSLLSKLFKIGDPKSDNFKRQQKFLHAGLNKLEICPTATV